MSDDFASYCPHCHTGGPGEDDYCGACGEPLYVPLEEDEELEERFGFGVCARGTCVEPCGPNGGCVAGARRRRSRGR